jgi:hypothetical protein
MAAALLRVLIERDAKAIVWFGFRVSGCRSTAKGAPWASFRSLGGFGKKQQKKI